ncbi:unnamed protein product [Trichobilharzia regenti]|nr:unnamed protein product [Trichobilharzia regenti]
MIKPNSVHRNLQQSEQPQQTKIKVEYSSLLINKSPNGCNLQIAYPYIVFKEWIAPYLKVIHQLEEISSTHLVNWLATVGQFYASVDNIDGDNSLSNRTTLCCDDELPTLLPILTINSGSGTSSENLLNENSVIVMPALRNQDGGIRKEAIFLPPDDTLTTSLTLSSSSTSTSSSSSWKETSSKLEMELFNFLLNCKKMNSSGSSTSSSSTRSRFHVISPKYFEKYSSSDPRRHQRWLKLFSKAGVSTLFSIHKVKYLYELSKIPSVSTSSSHENTSYLSSSSSSGDVIPLPANHALSRCIHKALSEKGLTPDNNSTNSMWLIEDYTAPGIELLLNCISTTMFSSTASIPDKQCSRQAAEYLAAILHNDWLTYEAYSSASYKCLDGRYNAISNNAPTYSRQIVYSSSYLPHSNTVINSNITYHLAYSSWFHKLRQTVWLPVEQRHTVKFTASPFQLLRRPTDLQIVYSPSAFHQLELQNKQLAKLFKQNSYIWSTGAFIVKKSLNYHFMKSIGLINNLGCCTIQVSE